MNKKTRAIYMLPTRDSLKNERQMDYIEEIECLLHENEKKAELSLKHNCTDFKIKTLTRDIKRHCVCMLICLFSHVQLFMMLWTLAHQAPQSMGFSRQEYWSRLPCSPPGDIPDPGIKPASLMSPA